MKTLLFGAYLLAAGTAIASQNDSTPILDLRTGQVDTLSPRAVLIRQLPGVVAELESKKVETSWIIFAFAPPGKESDDNETLYLQYSIEGGKLGLDWVLMDPHNIADRDKVATFIAGQHFAVIRRDGNGVKYLRVEGTGLAELGLKIVRELYQVKDNAPMTLFNDPLMSKSK
jgi:hypothetical protein